MFSLSRRHLIGGLGLVVTLVSFNVHAQTAGKTPSTADYVKKAAIGDMFEIQSSKLALDRADDGDVKDFAQMMITDHTKSTQMIKAAVAQGSNGVEIPHGLDGEHERLLKQLEGEKGKDFDKLYLQIQEEAHRQALELHQSYAERGEDAPLRMAANQIVPVVSHHLERLAVLMKDKD